MQRHMRISRVFASVALVFVVAFGGSASALLIVHDDLDYATGSLDGQNGGTGDWKDKWSGDSDITVVNGSYTYTDSFGNILDVFGNSIEVLPSSPGSPKRLSRPLNTLLGSGDVSIWMSVMLAGDAVSSLHNISLGDGLFFGQGDKDMGTTNWVLSDPDGVIGDTGISAAGQALLVLRVDFSAAGAEEAWLWVDPDLNIVPGIGSADATGSVKEFEADFIQLQLELNGTAGLDEIRVGDTFADVTPFTIPAPEPGTAAMLAAGLLGLGISGRRRS